MKKTLLSLIFLVAFTFQAHADEFDFTGLKAADLFDLGWSADHPSFVGGPAADDILGIAQQFTVSQPIQIKDLNVEANILTSYTGTTSVDFGIFDQTSNTTLEGNPSSPIPDGTSLTFLSNPLTYNVTLQQSNETPTLKDSQQLSFNDQLSPGTYWLAEFGSNGGPQVGFDAITYDINSQQTAVTPEPPSLMLLLLALTGMAMFLLFRRRLRLV